MKHKNTTNKSKTFRAYSVIALLILSVALFSACNTAADKAEEVGGVTAAQIIENPAAYVGKTVTVSGDVEEVWDPRAFNMDSGASVGELLVVGKDPFPQVPGATDNAYVVSDIATVTGTIRNFVAADIEKEIGWDLMPDIESKFNGKPVLVAQSVAFKPGANRKPATTAPVTGTTTDNDNMATGDEITDEAMIVDVPERTTLVGKRVNLEKVKVLSVIGDRTFYVGQNDGKRFLVAINQEATPNTAKEGIVDINAGQMISLKGEFMQIPDRNAAKEKLGGNFTDKELDGIGEEKVYLLSDSNSIKILDRP